MIQNQIIEFASNNSEIIVEALTKGIATAVGKTFSEKTLKLLGFSGGKIFDEANNLTEQAKHFFFGISKKYIENYVKRHGTMKVLGMGEAIRLESIYTKVNFRPQTISNYGSIADIEQIFRQRECEDQEKRLALDVAKEKQYLMVLGHPGSGKTTFLRKVGLEALKGKKGEYNRNHLCIPVFLELRDKELLDNGKVNLLKAIADEFNNCGLPEYEKCTEELLQQGKLLIILDGLDEVPSEHLSAMTREIRNLLDKYSDNRFIASCRIAAYRNFDSFRRFCDVSIADFDDQQVEIFIQKWFESHDQVEWGQKCWQDLSNDSYKGTKELTKTPLLLTLICILYRKTGQFPLNRTSLYEKTLRVLLEEWDASKQIARTRVYESLDTKRKELLLAQVAYDNFVDDQYLRQFWNK